MTTPNRNPGLTVVQGVDVRFDGTRLLKDQAASSQRDERRKNKAREPIGETPKSAVQSGEQTARAQLARSPRAERMIKSDSQGRPSTEAERKEREGSAAGAIDPASYDIGSQAFDPQATELQTTWSSHAPVILCLNTYPNGITLSVHQNAPVEDTAKEVVEGPVAPASLYSPQQFHLRFRDTRDYQLPGGKYFLHRENFFSALEGHLSQLRKNGLLSETVLYFGTTTDPFLSLHKKFDVTMGVMELFERYVPGRAVFQTRSPMVISVLPALKALAEKAVVVMPIESISERAISRYTPGTPKIGERLVAAEGLRRQGVKVNLAVSPILPYGDPKRDAWDFAEILDRHADYITFGALASGQESDEKQLKSFPVAQKLESDEQFFFLRPHCFQYVYLALKALAPEKLELPVKKPAAPSQLKLFAA